MGRFNEARDCFGHALSLSEELMAKFPRWPPSREILADVSNALAWLLARCSDPQIRQPAEAVKLARRAVELAPEKWNNWATLGVAHYRVRDWDSALKALERSSELNPGAAGDRSFFLAMAHWRKGDKDQARQCYDTAVDWMERNKPQDDEYLRLRTEAAAVLGINDQPPSTGKKEESTSQRSKP
jgi:eukaryotic-like serine/threonine-protein kinase